MMLEKNDIILFEGDSITDAGRDRTDKHSLSGYPKIIAEKLPEAKVYNRGVSGDTSASLLARLKNSLEQTKPTVFSLLIGINDVWNAFRANNPTTPYAFGKHISEMLEIVLRYTDRIIILETFLMPSDPLKMCFRADLDSKIQILRQVATKYKTNYVPMDGIFAELSIKNGAVRYAEDGIHPTSEGFRVIAESWLARF